MDVARRKSGCPVAVTASPGSRGALGTVASCGSGGRTMPNPDTITRGAGQARRSAARLIRTIAKYAALTLAGIILFRAGAAYGLKERGYSAAGGEAQTFTEYLEISIPASTVVGP